MNSRFYRNQVYFPLMKFLLLGLIVFVVLTILVGSPISHAGSPCSNDPNVGVSGCDQSECAAIPAYWNNSLLQCEYAVLGCTNPNVIQYDLSANTDDGSCGSCSSVSHSDCSQSACSGVDGYWDTSDASNPHCRPNTRACTDPNAVNYDSTATVADDDSCLYCDVNSPGNCTDELSCSDSGGVWYSEAGTCGLSVSSSLDVPDPSDSVSYATSASPDHFSVFQSRCISVNSSGYCDRWSFDASSDLINFFLSAIYQNGLNLFALFLVFSLSSFFVFKLLKFFF